MTNDGAGWTTQAELLQLHRAILRHCACQLSTPAVLEKTCTAHLMLRDDALVRRLVLCRRGVRDYLTAEFADPNRRG